jgi:alpha-beta hydrolase superfamily lysophospholipase
MPWLVQDLAAHGAVVYGFDQRGSGVSAGKRGHIMAYSELVSDLDQFIKLAFSNEPGLDKVLFGHSTGGILALTWAYENPQELDRLILSAPALILAYAAPAWKTTIGKALASVVPTFTQKAGFDTRTVSRDVDWVLSTMNDPVVSQDITSRFYREVYLVAAPGALARIEELKVPFLYIHGGGDRLVSPRVAEEFRRRATAPHTIQVYEGAFHETFNDTDREKVFADIESWLEAPVASPK